MRNAAPTLSSQADLLDVILTLRPVGVTEVIAGMCRVKAFIDEKSLFVGCQSRNRGQMAWLYIVNRPSLSQRASLYFTQLSDDTART